MAKARPKASRRSSSPELQKYLDESMRPLVMLAFLAPLALFYHFGSGAYHANIVAFGLLQQSAGFLGVYGHSVPLILLVLILLGWHLFRHDKWSFRLSTLSLMAAESLVLTIPLFLLGILSRHWAPLVARGTAGNLGRDLALSAGAGVYEELVFRFILCGLLMLIFGKAMALRNPWPLVLTIVSSSVLFSVYHYMGSEHFTAFTFVFRTLAGAYLASLYLFRGLAVTAGAHAFYDVLVALFVGL